ncbi:MAG: NAD(P)/FAD-dependent oxidoreductase [Planctomycetia bacterium]|jgi:predicted Rossmann fold flavoprotein
MPEPARPSQSLSGDRRVAVLVVGAGAAGLFAATWAGRTARRAGRQVSVRAVDGARRLGAKILVAGGGRCNVTHERVSADDYAGSTAPAIRKVLRRFDVAETVAFFAAAGVALKREETGKLFPVTDSARTVLDALVAEARAAGTEIVHPVRIDALARTADGFIATSAAETIRADRVILATGGKSLPKSGSDGGGFALATGLGHTLTAPIVPALVPLLLPAGHWITALSGLTLEAEVVLRTATGRRLRAVRGSTLCTHQGLSGPAVLDISRHWLVARHAEPGVTLTLNWLPGLDEAALDALLVAGQARGPLPLLRERLSERLARSLCAAAGVPAAGDLPRDIRRRLAALVVATPLPISGDRGFAVAEATAGGVPLAEVRLETMESRICPGLHFAGELLDVDGRIGGFNFQWAWASGFVAGSSAASAGSVAVTS